MRRLKDSWKIVIDRPFAIFVEESYDVPGTWVAHIVGHGLDNVTQGHGPIDTVEMVADLFRALTCQCVSPNVEHDWSIDGGLKSVNIGDDGEDVYVPSWTCSRCGESASKTEFDE